MVFFSLRQLVLVLVLVVTFVLADSVSFTFDNSDTSQQHASIAWGPSKILDGELDKCENDPQTAPTSCEGFWWSENDIDGAFNDTLQVAFGPKATLNFTFIGDSVQVWGVKYNVGANATYKLDDGAPSTFSTFSDSEEPQFQQLLLSLSNLDARTHSLVISYDRASFGPDGDRKLLNIDFFKYTTPSTLLNAILHVEATPTAKSHDHTAAFQVDATATAKSHDHTKTSHKAKTKPTDKPVYAAEPTVGTVSGQFLYTVSIGSGGLAAPVATGGASGAAEFSAGPHPANKAPLVIGVILALVAFILLMLFTFFLCKQRRETRAMADKLGPVEAFVAEPPSSADTSRPFSAEGIQGTARNSTAEEANALPTYDGGLSFGEVPPEKAGRMADEPLAGEAALPPSYHQATRQWSTNGPPVPPVPLKEEKRRPLPLRLV